MKRIIAFSLLVTLAIMSCHNKTQEKDELAPGIIPSSLRQGIQVNQKTINIALEMQKQGWKYIMPRPKSPQAAWGNSDGRTTWFRGCWVNGDKTSSTTPVLKESLYVGDDLGSLGWRRGGSPRRPTKIEWLLSESGGIEPD